MRVNAGTTLSLTIHVALAAAVVWKTVDAHPYQPSSPQVHVLVPPDDRTSARAPGLPDIAFGAPDHGSFPNLPDFNVPSPGVPAPPVFHVGPPSGSSSSGATGPTGGAADGSLVEEPPVILAGPVPAYPELLRQAGVEGRVVLEAIVDTSGRVEAGSLTAVSATHPGFVAAAQRAVAATLFRPARIGGRAVRVRVRVPIDFKLHRT